jgi:hypothetical protein
MITSPPITVQHLEALLSRYATARGSTALARAGGFAMPLSRYNLAWASRQHKLLPTLPVHGGPPDSMSRMRCWPKSRRTGGAPSTTPAVECYAQTCDQLGVNPADAWYVGDGAGDELIGAARAGLTPILLHSPTSIDAGLVPAAWTGRRITSIVELVEPRHSS